MSEVVENMKLPRWIMAIKNCIIYFISQPQVCFLRRLFSDSTLGLMEEERVLVKLCQVKSGRSVFADRFWEWRSFYGLSYAHAYIWFLINGFPFSRRLYKNLMLKFENKTSEKCLFIAYEQAAMHYSAELMLSMHRVQWVWPFLPDIKAATNNSSKCKVLEYGCGASDLGLLFSKCGAEVTIVDLENSKLKFARWRYQIRNLDVKVVGIMDTVSIPLSLVEQYDLVLATEILEHVRDPLALLRALTESLKLGGLLFSSMGLSFEREVGGDHLVEAAKIGQSKDYDVYFKNHYRLFATREAHPWLFVRIR